MNTGDNEVRRVRVAAEGAILPPAAALWAAESGGGTPCPAGEADFIEKGTPEFRRKAVASLALLVALRLFRVPPLQPAISGES